MEQTGAPVNFGVFGTDGESKAVKRDARDRGAANGADRPRDLLGGSQCRTSLAETPRAEVTTVQTRAATALSGNDIDRRRRQCPPKRCELFS